MKYKISAKKVKLILWFALAIVLDLTLMQKIRIFGAKPMLTYSMIASVMLLEDDFSVAMIVAFTLAIVCASLFMNSFAVEAIFIMLASVAIFSLGKKIRYIPGFIICGVISAIVAVIHSLLCYIIADGFAAIGATGNILVANAIYTFLAAMLIHYVMSRSVYTITIKKYTF